MRVAVVGAGIVGLAVARSLVGKGHEVVVLDKESTVAAHQTGRNSGVIHSGLYYKPGSTKARMCVAGARSMKQFAEENDIAMRTTGKLVVATSDAEVDRLDALEVRGRANGVPLERVNADKAREIEPRVSARDALHVKSTGIIDYGAVCEALASHVTRSGGSVELGEAFHRAQEDEGGVTLTTSVGERRADVLVNCAGLYSDRVAIASGLRPSVRIVPFRGEYYELIPKLNDVVKGLIYPVPDPRFPFLGVHLTTTLEGRVHAGPNAVVALRREGYTWRDLSVRESLWTATWPGTWILGARNIAPGAKELQRSLSARSFARSLSRLVPGISASDLVRAPAGVRAQALHANGALVDDFAIERSKRTVHVLSAPSPAATAALEIGSHIEGLISGI